MSRTLRTAFTVATIALALTACGTADQDTAQAPAEAPTTTAAPATEAPAIETPAPETPATPAPDAPADQPTPAVAPAPTTPPVPEHRRCSIDQAPDGGNYRVIGIKADDKDGGLTARSAAGYHYRQIGLFFNDEVVGTFADSPDWPSCLVTADNNVWWEIHSPILPAGGWVNARYLTVDFGDVTFPESPLTPEEPDAHGDCVYLPDLPETCVLVFRMGADIVEVESYDDEMHHELLFACLYQDHMGACDVLGFEGQDIGVHLLELSDDDVLKMCSEDGARGKVGCGELDRRTALGEFGI